MQQSNAEEMFSEISLISKCQESNSDTRDSAESSTIYQSLLKQFLELEILYKNTEDNIRKQIRSLTNQIVQRQHSSQILEKQMDLAKNELKQRKNDITVLLGIIKGAQILNNTISKPKPVNKSNQKSTSKNQKVSEKKKSPKRVEIKQKQSNKSIGKTSPSQTNRIIKMKV